MSRSHVLRLFIGSLAVVLIGTRATAQLPAFPGAEGAGALVTGGRGGNVYHVTNLNDAGPGSFRYGLDTAFGTPRTIVFDVGGTIALKSDLSVRNGNITIAGQTAPGGGITLTQYGLGINAGNVILQHLRVRPGDAQKGSAAENKFNGDAVSVFASNVMIDHVSASWGIDENLSVAGAGFKNVTVQYSTIAAGLDQTGLYHGEYDPAYNPGGPQQHSMGSLIKPLSGNAVATLHHNLWESNGNRNPAVGTYNDNQTLQVDVRNNVLYNNRDNGYSSGESKRIDMNYVGNTIVAGPETKSAAVFRVFNSDPDSNMRIYQTDNKLDYDKNGTINPVDLGWDVFTGTYTRMTSPFNLAPVTTQSADDAYDTVLAQAGAFPWYRDAVDQRLVSQINGVQGKIIDSQSEVGGYPTLPTINRAVNWDTDGDGMPDLWEELISGLNPFAPDQNGDLDHDGYTNLEEYLHFASAGYQVPEPSGLVLGTLALAALAWRRRKRFVRRA